MIEGEAFEMINKLSPLFDSIVVELSWVELRVGNCTTPLKTRIDSKKLFALLDLVVS